MKNDYLAIRFQDIKRKISDIFEEMSWAIDETVMYKKQPDPNKEYERDIMFPDIPNGKGCIIRFAGFAWAVCRVWNGASDCYDTEILGPYPCETDNKEDVTV